MLGAMPFLHLKAKIAPGAKSLVHALLRQHRNGENDYFSPGKRPPGWWDMTAAAPAVQTSKQLMRPSPIRRTCRLHTADVEFSPDLSVRLASLSPLRIGIMLWPDANRGFRF